MRQLLIFIWTFVCAATVTAAEPVYDVVVYGGTAGGVAAAVQVARMGKSVVLLEPGKHLGGMTSGGLGATDIGNKAAIGGISREFYQRVYQHYAKPESWTSETSDQYWERYKKPRDPDTMWAFEPHVAENILKAMLDEAGVKVFYDVRIDETGTSGNGRISALVTEDGVVFVGRVFIDATYEGDLMKAAGVKYHVGRESNATYGETFNGVQATRESHGHQFPKPVDPYVTPGDPTSGVLPGVHAGGPGVEDEGDHRVQAYNYRICATDDPANRVPWPKPADYDPARYELLLRNFEAGDDRIPWLFKAMPNRKSDCNNHGAFSTDNIGMNYDYPDADDTTREKIIAEHISYDQGFLWTLANSPRVPADIREYFNTWGLAKDEFVDTNYWPHQLYVREARRMIGEYVMTEHNCVGKTTVEDPVGLAAYQMDSHNTQRYVDAEGHACNEGDIQVSKLTPYPISYRSIVPKRGECSNLLVPVCMSASHIAYGSIRMEPVFMVLGQSAATAACQAIDDGVAVQDVDYPKLRQRLLDDKQFLEWTP